MNINSLYLLSSTSEVRLSSIYIHTSLSKIYYNQGNTVFTINQDPKINSPQFSDPISQSKLPKQLNPPIFKL